MFDKHPGIKLRNEINGERRSGENDGSRKEKKGYEKRGMNLFYDRKDDADCARRGSDWRRTWWQG